MSATDAAERVSAVGLRAQAHTASQLQCCRHCSHGFTPASEGECFSAEDQPYRLRAPLAGWPLGQQAGCGAC